MDINFLSLESHTLAWIVLIISFSLTRPTWAQTNSVNCAGYDDSNKGALDYRTERGARLKIVEDYHFTPNVESLIRGNSSSLAGELDYTLSRFPNHLRALLALERLTEKLAHPRPHGAKYEIECYFLRAINFRRDDSTVRLMYANFLSKKNRNLEASNQLEEAIAHAGNNGLTYYNAGLIYFKIKKYDQANQMQNKSKELGLSLTDLQDQLIRIGQRKIQDTSE